MQHILTINDGLGENKLGWSKKHLIPHKSEALS